MAEKDTTTDFTVYAYSELLQFLNNRYDDDTEDVNYAHVLLSMNTCASFPECIKIYKRVYNKIQAFLHQWSQSGLLSLDEKLNRCFDENILRIMKESRSLTDKVAYLYLANLRKCDGLDEIYSQWEDIAKKKGLDIVGKTKQTIIQAYRDYENAREEYLNGCHQSGTNAYNKLVDAIKSSRNQLKEYGYYILPYDIELAEEQERKSKIIAWCMVIGLFLLVLIFGGWEILLGLICLMGFFGAMVSITQIFH